MENLVTKYKKINVFDNLYFYKFVGLIEDVNYDYFEQCAYYKKKGTTRCLYEIENIYFTVSDEKYCFSEYLEKDQLVEMYQTYDDNKLKELLIDDCKNMIKFGIFDEKKDILKLVNSDSQKIKKARPDSYFGEYYLSSTTGYDTLLTMPAETLDSLLYQLENNNKEDVLNILREIKGAAEKIQSMGEDATIEIKNDKEENSILSKEEEISNLFKQLEELIGLKNVKEIVDKLINYLDYINKTSETQNLEIPNLHMVFKGNPGTGKTTVARILAKLLYQLSYVKEDKFVEITAQDLIAGYVGQTAIKTRKLLDENKGGVIFLDEAYVMCSQHESFADESLVEILKEMELKETIFIFAGYEQEMTDFMRMNPGFKSRVGSVIDFADYSLDELFQILIKKLNMHNLVLHEDAEVMIKKIIDNEKGKENFGNGRYINHLFDKMIMNHALNCKGIDDIEILKTIAIDDLNNIDENEKTKEKIIGFRV